MPTPLSCKQKYLHMIRTFQKYATGLYVGFSGFLLLLTYLFLNTINHPISIRTIKELSSDHTILNLLPYYDSTLGYEHMMAYTPTAIAIYERILVFDLVLLIPVYVSFFCLGAYYYVPKLVPRWLGMARVLSAAAVVAGFLNIVEDTLVYSLLNALPEQKPTLMNVSGLITFAKSSLISICMLTLLVFIVIDLIQRLYFNSVAKTL